MRRKLDEPLFGNGVNYAENDVRRSLAVRIRWDVAARIAGVTLGFGSIVLWPLTGHPPTDSIMTFAAALIVVPAVASAQEGRNAARRGRERHEREAR